MGSKLEEMIKRGVKVYDTVPEGFYRITGAGNAPRGYRWYNNRKSMFTDEYEQILVREDGNRIQSEARHAGRGKGEWRDVEHYMEVDGGGNERQMDKRKG